MHSCLIGSICLTGALVNFSTLSLNIYVLVTCLLDIKLGTYVALCRFLCFCSMHKQKEGSDLHSDYSRLFSVQEGCPTEFRITNGS